MNTCGRFVEVFILNELLGLICTKIVHNVAWIVSVANEGLSQKRAYRKQKCRQDVGGRGKMQFYPEATIAEITDLSREVLQVEMRGKSQNLQPPQIHPERKRRALNRRPRHPAALHGSRFANICLTCSHCANPIQRGKIARHKPEDAA